MSCNLFCCKLTHTFLLQELEAISSPTDQPDIAGVIPQINTIEQNMNDFEVVERYSNGSHLPPNLV